MFGFGRRAPSTSGVLTIVLVATQSQCRGQRVHERTRDAKIHKKSDLAPAARGRPKSHPDRGPQRTDAFGIRMLYPSAPGGIVWTSEHWLGAGYAIKDRIDAYDPLELSGMRGRGSLSVARSGELVMKGEQPRLYIYPPSEDSFKNVEVSVYYRRVADTAVPQGGLVVGIRSGSEGHASRPCEAHTYYARLRHDGATDYAKELMHPATSVRGRTPLASALFRAGLPFDRWVGWKVVAYNLPGTSAVKLESYLDLTEARDGGVWVLVNETIDDGGWFSGSSCAQHSPVGGRSDHIYLGGGATLIRNTGTIEARYRWLSVREIAAPPTSRR